MAYVVSRLVNISVTPTHILIPQQCKTSFILLFGFIYSKIVRYIFKLPILFLLTVSISYLIFDNQLLKSLVLKLVIVLLIFPISIALEETFHAAVLISSGREEEVRDLFVALVSINGFELFATSVAVHFVGRFSPTDIIRLSFGGPGMALVLGVILSVLCVLIVNLLAVVHAIYMHIIIFSFIVSPLISLLPINARFESDGLKIFNFKKQLKLSFLELAKELLVSLQLGFHFLYSSKIRRGYDVK